MTSFVQWLQENLFHSSGLAQLGAVCAGYLLSWLLASKVRQHLEKDEGEVNAHWRFALSPIHFTIMLKFIIWLLLIWFLQVLLRKLSMPNELLRMVINLILALAIVRFASFYIKSAFWSRLVYLLSLIFLSLRVFNLWGPTVKLLDSMKIEVGRISISIWNLTEAITVFILLLAATGAANRFFAHWLTRYTHLTYSDRTLLQRAIKAAMVTVVILISLKAAGIDMAAVVVTGGAIGFAIGIGLQKIGSNLISGMMLLINKPIRQGDVIAFEKGSAGAGWGWIAQMDLMYVQVATRNGSLLLVPNEFFLTQKIENLSYDNNRVRLSIPFGVAYDSDLNKTKTLGVSAATSVARVLKVPEPKCRLLEFGDSTVNLELRVWIDDPKNGIQSVKDAVLAAVWDSFHANGIEIAFPQRDLHIKDAVPFKILRDAE